MNFEEIMAIVLPVVYVLVGIALIWLIIELVRTLRKARKTVDELQQQVTPTLQHVEAITAQLEPVVAKVDPLVERVSLTVDAANLEIMRVDQILENVGEITDSVGATLNTVNDVANLPLDVVSSVSEKVRGFFGTKKASDESVALGQGKAETAALADKPAAAEAPSSFGKGVTTVVGEMVDTDDEFEPEPAGAPSDATVVMGAVAAEVAAADADDKAGEKKYFTY